MQSIEQNMRFMLLEVTKQLENTLKVLEAPSDEAIEKVEERDDYIDNLKSVIENTCYKRIHAGDAQPGADGQVNNSDFMRAVNTAGSNLEHIADHAVNVARQTRFYSDPQFLQRFNYHACFKELFTALDSIYDAFFKKDMNLAFVICRCEFNLDTLYKKVFDDILKRLRSGRDTGNLITTLFIFRYLERMGDAMLNVGEAAIYANTGDKMKIRQYNALKEALQGAGAEIPISNVEFKSIWGTRSGCRIGKVKAGDATGPFTDVIFKEGNKKKLLEEDANIKRWERIMPGLPPKVVALREEGANASILVEYLGGCTVQDVVLFGDAETVANCLFVFESTVRDLWTVTMKDEPVNVDFIGQCLSRLTDSFRLYPDFDFAAQSIGGVHTPSLRDMLAEIEPVSRELVAPFSVFIHGDFNINNIMYSHDDQRIHYIDLNRSRDTDYLQDVSVFLVSCFRLPFFQRAQRDKLNQAALSFLDAARSFGIENGDTTFDARLALGLVRSLLTSVRFELGRKHARRMFNRGVYILERLLEFKATGKPWEEFRLDPKVVTF